MCGLGPKLPFNRLFYLFNRISLFVKLEGPQGLPQTDVSNRCMVIDVAT